MPDAPDTPQVPVPPDERDRPRIGVDEWVAEAEHRDERYVGRLGEMRRRFDQIPRSGLLVAFIAISATVPLMSSSDYIIRVGINTILFALLALGLNIVVGYAGLLDLGYVAFYGFGAYAYALMSSNQFHVHWPAEVTVPLVVLGSALLGLVLGLPSRRLLGDYLAIVTLFFGQAFFTLVNNANRITLPWNKHPTDFTGGPNGVTNVDQIKFFGYEFSSLRQYFWLSLGTLAVVMVLLHFVNESRTGRAWRALREDPLAAEVMSMPVNRLKLLAFMFGAATAGLTGTIFAAVQINVFPEDFYTPVLITIYAMVILGGAGSIAGAVVGAITINVVLEVLRTPDHARYVFYFAILAGLIVLFRPWWRLALVLAGTIGLGFAVHAIVDATWPRGTAGSPSGGGWIAHAIDNWVILPRDPYYIANVAFGGLIFAVLALTLLKGWWRTAFVVPVLYLAAFVWENRLVQEGAGATRLILLGSILIVLMHVRPQGLFGTARVEIV
jgi:branched-chain amino acid transport system permease protein